MKMSKRILSLVLSLSMIFSLTANVFAASVTEESTVESAIVLEDESLEVPADEVSSAEETTVEAASESTQEAVTEEAPAETTESEEASEPAETLEAETEETEAAESETVTEAVETEESETAVKVEETEETETTAAGGAAAIGLELPGIETMALNITDKPANGTTAGQPFIGNTTAGSACFRIPAIVTLNSGRIVAAADARWNRAMDGGGMDTIVSWSDDNGANWNYTMANYLGDNGNVFNKASSSFLDPALATDGETVYMLVDLFPAGYALNTASADHQVQSGDAFDAQGHLLLKKEGENRYRYYLDGTQIKSTSGGAVEAGYTVDAMFNITGNGVNTNLFFSDSPYKPMPTTYLYLTKSTDGGETWSAPKLLDVKKDDERFYGVGPGRGLVLDLGNGKQRILFPCYTNYGIQNNEYASFIYSDDGGTTWTRTKNLTEVSGANGGWTSEVAVTKAGDKLYAFSRTGNNDYGNVTYFVSSDNGATWSAKIDDNRIDPCTKCQMSAVTNTYNDKTYILLSCASGGSRTNGKIYAAEVQADGSLNWLEPAYAVNENGAFYAYSSMAVLSDGNIGLLYESAADVITYKKVTMSEIVGDNAGSDISVDVSADSFEIVANMSGTIATHNHQTVEHVIVTSDREYPVTIYMDGEPLAGYDVSWTTEGGAKLSGTDDASTNVSGTGKVIATISKNGQVVAVKECTVETIAQPVGEQDGWIGSYNRNAEIYIQSLENSVLYYQQNGGSLIKAEENTVIYINTKGYWNFTYYAGAANEDYTLVDLYGLKDADNKFWSSSSTHDGSVASGCVAYDQFNRGGLLNSGDLLASINARSVKLPTLSKSIRSITRNGNEVPYNSNMAIELGDTINYDIAVRYFNATDVTLSNVTVTDELTGYSNTKNTVNISSAAADANGVVQTDTHTTSLTVNAANMDKVVKNGKIVNTAKLTYQYTTKYSSGTKEASATASAAFRPKESKYVIDFGTPVTIDLTGVLGADIVSATAQYGTVAVNGQQFTYTPNQTLKGMDSVVLTLTNGGPYSVSVYPATSVFYEETMTTYTDTAWTSTGTPVSSQNAAELGKDANNYGFDSSYVDAGATYLATTTINEAMEFNFTGTGVTLYANTNTNTGKLIARIYKMNPDGTKKAVKMYSVDTAMRNGTTSVTANQEVNDTSFPIISMQNLEHGTYQMLISYIKSEDANGDLKPICIDGFRVYGTLPVDSDVYAGDNEQAPSYLNLRDALLNGYHVSNVEAADSKYVGTDANGNKYYISQVYDETAAGTNAITYVSAASNLDVSDLLDNGPKNQIYLHKNEGITFKMTGSFTEAQLGMKRIGNAAIMVNGTSVNAGTDMFYTLSVKSGDTVTISNNGEGILAITDLKTIGGAASLAAPATEAVASFARGIMLLSLEPDEPVAPVEPAEPETADASLTVSVLDQNYEVLASTTLTQNGNVGESYIFTADEIQAAVEALAIEGYTLDTPKYYDVEVAYGAEGSFECYASEIVVETADAVVTIELKNIFGSVVANTRLAYNGEVGESHTFTADEVKAAVKQLAERGGYKASALNSYKAVTVNCGESKKVSYYYTIIGSWFN